MENLEGKIAFVTGAASGIGLGVSTALAQAGVKVMMCDIEEPVLAEKVAALQKTNADVEGVVADIALKDQIRSAADATLDRFGKVHILINNAGVGGGGGYGQWTDDAWKWTLDVNLLAVIWGVEIFGPLMEQHGEGGHIVSTASVAGLIAHSGTPYNVSKYGVVALSEGLRVELEPRGIGVSVLCPGFIRTKIADSSRNLPERYGDAFAGRESSNMPTPDFINEIRDRISNGIDPNYVGELVREGIVGNWDYIFTDTEFEPVVEARFQGIKAAFDRIRNRTPVR